MGIKILAAGKFLPNKVVTNEELAPELGIDPNWIFERSGIRERRWVDNQAFTSDLAALAAKDCLQRANLTADDVDCYIFATLSPDHMFPGIGNYAQRKIGITRNVPCFDLRQQCTGFIFGTQMAAAFLEAGLYRRVMVVGAEIHSTNLDRSPTGREVTMLFGDGAGAVIYEKTDAKADFYVRTYSAGEHADILHTDMFDVRLKPVTYPPEDKEHLYPHMEGRKVFVHAVEGCGFMLQEWMKANGEPDLSKIDLFLFHQANKRINAMVGQKFQISEQKAPSNIHKYGNCSAASIPLLMSDLLEEGRIKPGMRLAMLGFGSGFNYGMAVVSA